MKWGVGWEKGRKGGGGKKRGKEREMEGRGTGRERKRWRRGGGRRVRLAEDKEGRVGKRRSQEEGKPAWLTASL